MLIFALCCLAAAVSGAIRISFEDTGHALATLLIVVAVAASGYMLAKHEQAVTMPKPEARP